jgi:hypothetical protein
MQTLRQKKWVAFATHSKRQEPPSLLITNTNLVAKQQRFRIFMLDYNNIKIIGYTENELLKNRISILHYKGTINF